MSFFNRNNKDKEPKNGAFTESEEDLSQDPSTYVYRGNTGNHSKTADPDPNTYVYQPDSKEETSGALTPEESDDVHSYSLKDLIREGANSSGSLEYQESLSLEERYAKNYEAERKILLRNIRRVASMVLALFIGLMSYLVYFQAVKAQDLRTDAGNRRNAEARNRVLRGAISDRNGKVLSQSTLHEDGSQTREYKGGVAFGNILGYVSDKYSITGLELSLDKELSKGKTLASFFTLDSLTSLINPAQGVTKKQEGNSVQLTLDTKLQNAAYDLLGGKKGSIVALNPKSGEILAMVSSPGFSAAKLDEVMKRVNEDKAYAADAPLINRTVNSVFAPGSTMKVVTLSSALANLPGLEQRTFDDQGIIKFADGTTISNFNGNVYGKMNLQEAFTNSSNYIFGNLGIELKNSQMKQTAEAFGFNKEISMNGLTARKSIFPSLGESEAGNKALSAIGQGEVAATPLQMVMVAAAVANNGQMVQPSIVSKITDKDNNILSSLGQPAYTQALTQDVAAKVANLMKQNVKLGGSSYQSLSSVNGAGKTGTGQFETGSGTHVNAWFIGYAPANNPQIAIAVCIEDLPDINESTGAKQAIPVARALMDQWINR